MKRVISLVFVLLFLLPFTAKAVNPIDPAHPSSLTLQYACQGEPFGGLQIRSYRIAQVHADGSFELTDVFSPLPVSLDGITSQSQWKEITSTLAAYIQADGLEAELTGLTDETGTVAFTDILPGIYLTLLVQVKTDTQITTFENFLTVIPQSVDGEEHNYQVTAIPKCQTEPITQDNLSMKVLKQWKDSGHSKDRPQSVSVEIYKDGQLHTEQTLSGANDWTYSWTAPNDGSQWQVVERDVPQDYRVTVTKTDTTFIITNTHKDAYEPPPKTGDTTVLWPYMLAMGISGAGLILVGLLLWRKKK